MANWLLAALAWTALSADEPKQAAAAPAGPPALDELWADLAKDEIPSARALLKLAAKGDELVPFLRKRLKPLAIDAKRVRALIADLGSKDDALALEAFETLDYFDPRLALELDELMAETLASPQRERLVCVLSRCDIAMGPAKAMKQLDGKKVEYDKFLGGDGANFRCDGAWWAEEKVERIAASYAGHGNSKPQWGRAVRAVVLLEHLGTPDARGLLEDLAGGHPDAAPTKAAQDALRRLPRAK